MNEIIKQNISLLKRNDEMAKEISKLKGLNQNLKKLLSKLLREDLNLSKSLKKAKDKETQTETYELSSNKNHLKESLMNEIKISLSPKQQNHLPTPIRPLRVSPDVKAQSVFIASSSPESAATVKSLHTDIVRNTNNVTSQYFSPFNEEEIINTPTRDVNMRHYESTPKSTSASKQKHVIQSISPSTTRHTKVKTTTSTDFDSFSIEPTVNANRASSRLSRSVKKPVSYKDTPLNSKIRRGFQFFQFEESHHEQEQEHQREQDSDNKTKEREAAASTTQTTTSAPRTQGVHTPYSSPSPRHAYYWDSTEGSSDYILSSGDTGSSAEYQFVSSRDDERQPQHRQKLQGRNSLYRSIKKACKDASDQIMEAHRDSF